MSAKYKSPSFLLPNELNTSANTANDTGINSLYSMKLDGASSQRVDISSIISSISSSSTGSISFWVKPESSSIGDWHEVISFASNTADRSYLIFYKSNTEKGYLQFRSGGSQIFQLQTNSAVFSANTWAHVVITQNGIEPEIYINGSKPAQTFLSSANKTYWWPNLTSFNTANINAMIWISSGTQIESFGVGVINVDEVAIFNRALNDNERAALYGGTSPNIYPSNLMATNLGPIAYYPLGEQAQNSGYPSATGNEWQFPNGVLQDYVMDFDGSSYINIGESILPSGNFTISAWVKPDSFPIPYATIFSSYENSASGRLLFRIKNDGKLELSLDSVTLTSNTSLSANTWQHVMVTLNGTSLTFYLNGSSDGSGTASTPPAQNLTTYIGAWDNSGSPNGYFNGEISNLAIWNTDQSANIADIYNNGSPQTSYTVSPQNWWKLNADSVYTPSVSKYPTALNFASSSYIISSSSVITGNSDRTVSVWAKTPNYVSKKAIFSLGDTTGSGSTTKFAIRINGTDDIQIASKGYDFLFSNTGIIVTDNNWHHFAATYSYSGSTAYFKLYIDGNYIGEQTGSLQLNTSAGFSIATWGYGTNRDFFNGDISNAVVYNSELTASQISTLFNFGTPETTPSFDPVAWWKLDDQTAITDSSGNGNTGTNNGATNSPGGVAYVPSWKITSALPIPTVNYTTALDFDGSSDYITVNQINLGTTNTISFWYYGETNTYSTILGNDNAPNDYAIFVQNGGLVYYKVEDSSNGSIQWYITNVIDGNWHHFAFSRTNTTVNFYIDGNLQTVHSNTLSNNDTKIDTIGAKSVGTMPFKGKLSNVAIYNSALSSSQVSTLFNSGQPEAAISLSPVSWWKLDTGGSTITDYGSGGNNGTNNGPATQATSDVLTSGFNIPVNGVSTTLPSTALQQSDLQFDSPYSNYSLSFDGISYINTGTDIGDSLGGSYSGDLTVSMWLKFNSISTQYGLFYIGDLASGGGSFWINTSASKLWVYANNGTAGYINCSISSLNTTDWYNVTCVYKGYDISNSKIYINNTSQTLTTSGNFNYTYDFTGKKTTIADYYTTPPFRGFNGKIDETALWNTALTEAQVLEIYNNGKPGNLDNFSGTAPISWWRLGENAYFNTGTTPGPEFTVPNSIAGAPNGIGSGTVATMLSADAPGTYANGIGDGLAITDRVGDAPLSVANSQSYNMIPDDKVPYVPGYVGAQIANNFSMSFDGVDDYFSALSPGFSITTEWSVSCWIKTNDGSVDGNSYRGFFATGGYGSSGLFKLSVIDTNGYVDIWEGNSSRITGNTNVVDNAWHNVVLTKNSSTLTLFVNGSQQNQVSNSSTWLFSDVYIAAGGPTSGDLVTNGMWSGQIDEVAIFDKALTADQIKFDLYSATTTGKTADIENNTNLPTPVAWYRMGD